MLLAGIVWRRMAKSTPSRVFPALALRLGNRFLGKTRNESVVEGSTSPSMADEVRTRFGDKIRPLVSLLTIAASRQTKPAGSRSKSLAGYQHSRSPGSRPQVAGVLDSIPAQHNSIFARVPTPQLGRRRTSSSQRKRRCARLQSSGCLPSACSGPGHSVGPR